MKKTKVLTLVVLHIVGLAIIYFVGKGSGEREVVSIETEKILVDNSYDYDGDPSVEIGAGEQIEAMAEALTFLEPYQKVVDSIMSPVVGEIAVDAEGFRPESPLSNLLADILVWSGSHYGERPVVGIYNKGGIRASLRKGAVTYGDVLEVAPFDNKVCFLTLSGEKLLELFGQIAARGGEGVSGSVRLTTGSDRKLLSATVNGKPIDPKAAYRIASIDYLAAGNDAMKAFDAKTDYNAPAGRENDCREVICRYFRAMKAAGKTVAPKIEGRITVNNKH